MPYHILYKIERMDCWQAYDITQIYNHVLEIYQDSQLRNRLIQQAKEDVYQLYDAKRMVKEHEKLFLSICDVGV